jgi:hypothetical protein
MVTPEISPETRVSARAQQLLAAAVALVGVTAVAVATYTSVTSSLNKHHADEDVHLARDGREWRKQHGDPVGDRDLARALEGVRAELRKPIVITCRPSKGSAVCELVRRDANAERE